MQGKLKDEHHADVRQTFLNYIKINKISMKSAAGQIGRTESVVSQWLKGKYRGDNDKTTKLINDWIERDARIRATESAGAYVKTWVAEAMKKTIDATCEMQRMLALVSASGSGKTMVIRACAEQRQGFYVYVDDNFTVNEFLHAVYMAVIGVPKKPTNAAMKRNLVARLRGTRRPLFIDEAHTLSRQCFSIIRSLHDQAGIPIIMTGTDKIIERIDDRANGNGQFFRRCRTFDVRDHITNVENPGSPKVGRTLYEIEEVRQFLAVRSVRFDAGAVELIYGIACLPGWGCLGTVHELVDWCRRKYPKQTVTRKQVIGVLSLFFASNSRRLVNLSKRHVEVHPIKKTA